MAEKSTYEAIFPFGKHRGKSLGFVYDSDPGYVSWIAANDKMPENWQEACKCVIEGKSITHINIPRQEVSAAIATDVQLWTVNKSTIGVQFAFNRELLERFKFEIDGRKWNGDEKHWTFPSTQIVKAVELFGGTDNIAADDGVKRSYRNEVIRRKELDEIRVLDDTELDIPGLKLNLFPYQKVGVRFIERAGGRAMVADAMGLGKTAQAIAYAHWKNLKTLVVVPKSVVVNWKREIERFTGKKATIWSNQHTETPPPERVGKILNWDDINSSF